MITKFNTHKSSSRHTRTFKHAKSPVIFCGVSQKENLKCFIKEEVFFLRWVCKRRYCTQSSWAFTVFPPSLCPTGTASRCVRTAVTSCCPLTAVWSSTTPGLQTRARTPVTHTLASTLWAPRLKWESLKTVSQVRMMICFYPPFCNFNTCLRKHHLFNQILIEYDKQSETDLTCLELWYLDKN